MPNVWSDPVFVRAFFKRAAQVFGFLIVLAVVFFVTAGTLDLSRAWLLFGIYAVNILANLAVFLKYSPRIIQVRSELKVTRGWDKAFAVLDGLSFFIMFAVAGLDVGRFHWSSLGVEWVLPGIAVYVLSATLVTWAITVNKFFRGAALVQKGQTVVTTGPYAFIRHPGYAAMAINDFSMPIVLGSAWALLPAAFIVLLFIARTKFEDEMLRKELKGYKEYARKVRWRLLPGAW